MEALEQAEKLSAEKVNKALKSSRVIFHFFHVPQLYHACTICWIFCDGCDAHCSLLSPLM